MKYLKREKNKMATGISNDYVVPPTAPSVKPHAPPPPPSPSPSPATTVSGGAAGPAEPDEVYDPHTRYPNTSEMTIRLNSNNFLFFFSNFFSFIHLSCESRIRY